MAWNQPGNKGNNNDKDPWGNHSKNSGDFLKKLKGLFGNKRSNGTSKFTNSPFFVVIIGFIIVVFLWFSKGFYYINNGDVGVVTRLGMVKKDLAQPGINWFPAIIDHVEIINTENSESLIIRDNFFNKIGDMGEANIELTYQIIDPIQYLFHYENSDLALRTMVLSQLRMLFLTLDNEAFESNLDQTQSLIQTELNKKINELKIGVRINSVIFKKIAFSNTLNEGENAQLTSENEEIIKAKAWAVEQIKLAENEAQSLLKEAEQYKLDKQNAAEVDYQQFIEALKQYEAEPEITKSRLYMNMLNNIMKKSKVIFMSGESSNQSGMILSLDNMSSLEHNKIDAPEVAIN